MAPLAELVAAATNLPECAAFGPDETLEPNAKCKRASPLDVAIKVVESNTSNDQFCLPFVI